MHLNGNILGYKTFQGLSHSGVAASQGNVKSSADKGNWPSHKCEPVRYEQWPQCLWGEVHPADNATLKYRLIRNQGFIFGLQLRYSASMYSYIIICRSCLFGVFISHLFTCAPNPPTYTIQPRKERNTHKRDTYAHQFSNHSVAAAAWSGHNIVQYHWPFALFHERCDSGNVQVYRNNPFLKVWAWVRWVIRIFCALARLMYIRSLARRASACRNTNRA